MNADNLINPMHSLIDRERIRGASRMIPEGTPASAVTPEQIVTVAADVDSFRRAHHLSLNDIGRAVGYSHTVIGKFIAGGYEGSRGQLAIDLENWLVEEEQRRQQRGATQFVWTNVALKIKSIASYCLDFKKIGLIYGPDASGIGKTMALRAIAQELGPRRCALCTIDKVDASPTGLLHKLCTSLRMDHNGSNRVRFHRLVKALKGRSHLLLIDQVHNMRGAKDDKPLYILADLFDATNVAQLWVGTADMVGYLKRQQGRAADESLAQIRRRIFPVVDLMESVRIDGTGEPLISIDQVREMFARNKLRLSDSAARFLCQLCNRPDSGGVGLCAQLVEFVTVLGLNLTLIDVPALKSAMRRGMTSTRAELLFEEMEQPELAESIAAAG